MTRTFLVTLEISSSDDPSIIAEDLLSDLLADGHPALSVSPWSAPDLGNLTLPT